MSLPAANKERCYYPTLHIGNLERVTSIAHWDELQDPSVAERIYRVVPLRIRRGSGSGFASPGFLICLIVASLPPTGDENRDVSCNVYRRIGYVEFGLEWQIREEGAEEEEDHTHETWPLDLLNIIFPNSISETITVI
jgi:hypothetical protein